MVKLMRVDDRRIHGQVAIAWSKALEFKVLMVASDVAAASKTQTMALKLSLIHICLPVPHTKNFPPYSSVFCRV